MVCSSEQILHVWDASRFLGLVLGGTKNSHKKLLENQQLCRNSRAWGPPSPHRDEDLKRDVERKMHTLAARTDRAVPGQSLSASPGAREAPLVMSLVMSGPGSLLDQWQV